MQLKTCDMCYTHVTYEQCYHGAEGVTSEMRHVTCPLVLGTWNKWLVTCACNTVYVAYDMWATLSWSGSCDNLYVNYYF